MNALTIREASLEILNSMPVNCSAEEIMYKINLAAQALDGLKDKEAGNVISTDDLLKRIDSWQQK
jgi:hypothetical protein